VGVEKVDIYKNGVILGDRKCLGDSRKSFCGILTRRNLGPLPADEFFDSHSPSQSPKNSRNTAEPNLPIYGHLCKLSRAFGPQNSMKIV
jgi:hypothetical protein